jgi:hypothetical protein
MMERAKQRFGLAITLLILVGAAYLYYKMFAMGDTPSPKEMREYHVCVETANELRTYDARSTAAQSCGRKYGVN